jgi:hypothetical protein
VALAILPIFAISVLRLESLVIDGKWEAQCAEFRILKNGGV